MRIIFKIIIAFAIAAAPVSAWITPSISSVQPSSHARSLLFSSALSSTDTDSLGLTPELARLTNAFQSINDDKLRYKQLLYMANQLAPMDDALKTPAHVVPGCLSTVHVYATLNEKDGTIHFQGDSDGLLTKGLVALLVRGLSGNSAQAIQAVDPKFIELAGISASLTPGRNNGFLNMLRVMKQQAKELEVQKQSASESDESSSTTSEDAGSSSDTTLSKYDAIIQALQTLQPTKLDLVDNSHQHAGHAGNDMDGESHFDLYICSDAFQGVNLVKRHKLVYAALGDLMTRIHALQIRAQTPAEAAK
jgi:sulfur transfer protein SufE/stress-induced morphogen